MNTIKQIGLASLVAILSACNSGKDAKEAKVQKPHEVRVHTPMGVGTLTDVDRDKHYDVLRFTYPQSYGSKHRETVYLKEGYLARPPQDHTVVHIVKPEFFDILATQIIFQRSNEQIQPIIILNSNGFFDELKAFLSKLHQHKVAKEKYKELYTFVDNPEDGIIFLRDYFKFSIPR